MAFLCCVLLIAAMKVIESAPAGGFVFPDSRQDKKLEPIITPPVLPVLEHLERDPSTLLPSERGVRGGSMRPKPRFGGSMGFSLTPTHTGLTASVSSSASGLGLSHSASQSFSFGFNEGFSSSHSASQAASFSSNGFGGGLSSSQAASQAGSFNGGSFSGAASGASSFGNSNAGSQSASSAFGFNSLNGFHSAPNEMNYGDGLLDVRHRGNFVFPGRGRAAAARVNYKAPKRSEDSGDWLAILVSD